MSKLHVLLKSETAKALAQLGHCAPLGMTYSEAAEVKYKDHVRSCLSIGERPDPFEKIVTEVLTAGSDQSRVAILEIEKPLAHFERPTRNFHQYLAPREA